MGAIIYGENFLVRGQFSSGAIVLEPIFKVKKFRFDNKESLLIKPNQSRFNQEYRFNQDTSSVQLNLFCRVYVGSNVLVYAIFNKLSNIYLHHIF